MKYTTVQALAEHLDKYPSTIHRALSRWQKEVGPRVIVARNGGTQKHFLLEQQDAERFVDWYLDRPDCATGRVSLEEVL